jgi:hypothetical protein
MAGVRRREPPHPVQRPPRAPRDWYAEAQWIRQIADGQIAKLRAEVIAGVGVVVAREREATRKQIETVHETIRTELKVAIAEARSRDCDRVIQRLDSLLLALPQSAAKLNGDGDVLQH